MEKFELTKRLTKGIYGEIFQAKVKNPAQMYGHKTVVLKLLNMASQNITVMNDINGEIFSMQKLTYGGYGSKYVVKYLDHFDTRYKGATYKVIVMEDLTNWLNLNDFMLNLHKKDASHVIDIVSLKKIISNMIRGLNYIHSHGLAHRDIKPENIMLDINCNIKYIDFGFSSPLNYNMTKGTPIYLPPETDFNRPTKYSNLKYLEMEKKHDIWSLGIVIYRLANIQRYPNNYPFLYEPSFNLQSFMSCLRKFPRYHKSGYPYIPNNIDINYLIDKMLSPSVETRPSSSKLLNYISYFN